MIRSAAKIVSQFLIYIHYKELLFSIIEKLLHYLTKNQKLYLFWILDSLYFGNGDSFLFSFVHNSLNITSSFHFLFSLFKSLSLFVFHFPCCLCIPSIGLMMLCMKLSQLSFVPFLSKGISSQTAVSIPLKSLTSTTILLNFPFDDIRLYNSLCKSIAVSLALALLASFDEHRVLGNGETLSWW